MRIRILLFLLLPVLMTGCLDMFFAPPVALSSGWKWTDRGVVLQSADPAAMVKAVVAPDGMVYCVYNDTNFSGMIVSRRERSGWAVLSGGNMGTGNSSVQLTASLESVPYLAFISNNNLYAFSWNEAGFQNEFELTGATLYAVGLGVEGNGSVMLAFEQSPSDLYLFTNMNASFYQKGVIGGSDIHSRIDCLYTTFSDSVNWDTVLFLSGPSVRSIDYATNSGSELFNQEDIVSTNGQALSCGMCIYSYSLLDDKSVLIRYALPSSGGWETLFYTLTNVKTLLTAQYSPVEAMHLMITKNDHPDRIVLHKSTSIASGAPDFTEFGVSFDLLSPSWPRALAVAPDGSVWVFAVVPESDGAAAYDLRAYRYGP